MARTTRSCCASIGINGQGNSLKRGFAKLKNVEIKTLCDVDENLFASRANDAQLLKDVPTFKPGFVQDLRRVLDDKDIDAVMIATPNHWHALATIWALQAGKHVYVEKPASHTVLEGRLMTNAARAYGKIVQTGTMNRSRPAVRQAIKFIQDGGIGKVYMARGLCFKPRLNIGKYPDGPMAAGEKPHAFTVGGNGSAGPYTAEYLAKVDYNLWLGPAPSRRSTATASTTTGTGTGTTATATPATRDRTSSTSRAGASASRSTRSRSARWAATSARSRPSQETPDMQTAMFEYADGMILEFGTRGEHTPDEGSVRIGNLFFGSKGWLWIDETGRNWQSYMGAVGEKNEKGPGSGDEGPERRAGWTDDGGRRALRELHRRHPRQRSEGSDVRHPRRAPVLHAAAPGEHRVPRRTSDRVRRQDRDDQGQQEGQRAPDAGIPQGLRDPEVVPDEGDRLAA